MIGLGLQLTTGCSLGMFGDGKDKALRENSGYRQVNAACAQMSLTNPSLDVKTTRELLDCFNSNGALQELATLVGRLDDARLEPIVSAVNKYILNDSKVLYQLEETHRTLVDAGILDRTLFQIGRLLENDEFVASLVALLQDGYFASTTLHIAGRNPDKKLLRAFEKVSTKITPETIPGTLNASLTLAESRSFKALQDHFRTEQPSRRSLNEITDHFLAYLQEPNHVALGRELINSLISHDLFKIFDTFVGTEPEELRTGIPKIAAILDSVLQPYSGKPQDLILDGLTSLLHYSHKKLPCLEGGALIPDPAAFVLSEFSRKKRSPEDAASFIKRENHLTLASMNSLCSYPPQLSEYYPYLIRLADRSSIGLIAELMRIASDSDRTLDLQRPMLKLMIDILADTGNGLNGGPAEDSAGVKHLTPLLDELNGRNAWNNLFLVVSLIRLEYREDLIEILKFAVEPTQTLDNDSLYDVLTDVLSRTKKQSLYNFVRSLRHFMNSDEPILVPALRDLRSAYYVNDVHPLFDVLHRFLAESTKNEAVFNTIFEISEMPEFQPAVALFSRMSKDGRMKDLLGAIFTIFHKFAREGATPIQRLTEPPFFAQRRHDLTSADLVTFENSPVTPTEAVPACSQIDLDKKLSDVEAPEFADQLENILSCLNGDQKHAELSESIRFLQNTKTESGQSYFALPLEILKTLPLRQPEFEYLVQSWLRSSSAENNAKLSRFDRLLSAAPFWLTGDAGGLRNPLRPLIDVAGYLVENGEIRAKLRHLETFLASDLVLRNSDFPELMIYGEKLLDQKPEPTPRPKAEYNDEIREQIRRSLEDYCDPSSDQEAKIQEIIGDYEHAITGWDLDSTGSPRRSWTFKEFQDRLEPALQKLGDPTQSAPDKPLLDSMFDFARYFTLGSGPPTRERHYRIEELESWLLDHSNDYRAIPYYYQTESQPGVYKFESRPRIRLVSTLDRLELLLVNADFIAPLLNKNFGLQFTAQIAEAWKDEGREIWPTQIQNKFRNKNPQTLAEALKDIESTQRLFEKIIGMPKMPKCRSENGLKFSDFQNIVGDDVALISEFLTKEGLSWRQFGELKKLLSTKPLKARLFNIRQMISVLRENLPEPGETRSGIGMKLLRDLFFELYYATPPEFRNPKAGGRNHLSLALIGVRMGATRQAGRLLGPFKEGATSGDAPDPSLKVVLSALVEGATARDENSTPFIQNITRTLLHQPKHELLWKILGELFAAIDDGKALQLRQLAYYALASAKNLDIISAALKTAGPLFDEYLDYFTTQSKNIGRVLRSKRAGYLVQALYEDPDLDNKEKLRRLLLGALADPSLATDALALVRQIHLNPKANAFWTKFVENVDLVTSNRDYQALDIGQALRPILDFFEEKPLDPYNPHAISAANEIRLHLADRILQGDLEQFLILARNHPDDFYRVLIALSHSIESKELPDFFALIRRGLSDAP
ncbi:MAG: hypothetical protein A2428_06535 [Bdellovibrionales bacterium RIFOXYC1_FULL_54_43]|nr:MAG: hypothetical protein A2428_06535 [Bdellovibrionales bacterium RIFOXYC1_FULL_54_43]OFZ85113.1 MAG: hypothetical protein A2603_07210 [Bdellovibrionales bacterium RIFOXYD1_FULL_55_31]